MFKNIFLLFSFYLFLACAPEGYQAYDSNKNESFHLEENYKRLQDLDPDYFGQFPIKKIHQLLELKTDVLFGDSNMNKHCDLLSLGPKLNRSDIPNFLANKTPKKILSKHHKNNTKAKKKVFLCHLIPAGVVANIQMLEERARLFFLIDRFQENKEELDNIAIGFGIKPEKRKILLQNKNKYQEELSKRVLPIPMSLLLAQASEESGWGLGRLANVCTNYFSLYATSTEVVPPECVAKKASNRRLMKYESILANTKAYLMRLNGSYNYYSDFRESRFDQIKNKKFSGKALSAKLGPYAENPHYSEDLRRHIRVNKLSKWDQIFDFSDFTFPKINKIL